MIGIYFSGTGNTKHCVEVFFNNYQNTNMCFPIEDKKVIEAIKQADAICFGYPVYFSNAPKIVKDFIANNKELWLGKKIFVIATMERFSGDGSGYLARLLKQQGAIIVGGMHIKMPNSIGDQKVLRKSLEDNKQMVKKAEDKIIQVARFLHAGKQYKEGLGVFSHILGLLGQRLWFYNKTKHYSNKVKINNKCIGCRKCAILCPMHNITIENNKAVCKSHCTMCYRCVNHCPKQAITLLGSTVHGQSTIEKYV